MARCDAARAIQPMELQVRRGGESTARNRLARCRSPRAFDGLIGVGVGSPVQLGGRAEDRVRHLIKRVRVCRVSGHTACR